MAETITISSGSYANDFTGIVQTVPGTPLHYSSSVVFCTSSVNIFTGSACTTGSAIFVSGSVLSFSSSSVITFEVPKIDLDSVAREFSEFKSRVRKTQNILKKFDKVAGPGTLFRLNESFNDVAHSGWVYYTGPQPEEVSFFFKENSLDEGWHSLPTGSLLLYVGLSEENYFSKFNFKTLKFLHNKEVVNWPASISAIEDQAEKLFNIFKKVE